MVVVVPLLLRRLAVEGVRDYRLGAVAMPICAIGLVQGLLPAKGGVVGGVRRLQGGLAAGRLVQVLPGLPVVAVEAAVAGLRAGGVEGGDGVTVG